jgi:hypothetical protein
MSKSHTKTGSRAGMEEPVIICSRCDEPFSSEHELRNHQQTVHAAELRDRRRSRENEPGEDEQETAA